MPFFEASQSAIDQFADALWLEDGLSRNTLSAYRSDLRHFAQWLSAQEPPLALDAAAEHHIQAYFSARHHGTRATTANRRLTVLRRYFHWALRERRIAALLECVDVRGEQRVQIGMLGIHGNSLRQAAIVPRCT